MVQGTYGPHPLSHLFHQQACECVCGGEGGRGEGGRGGGKGRGERGQGRLSTILKQTIAPRYVPSHLSSTSRFTVV